MKQSPVLLSIAHTGAAQLSVKQGRTTMALGKQRAEPGHTVQQEAGHRTGI